MIQHMARGMFGAIIVDPKDKKRWPKPDREYLVQSELFLNADDVQAMFDRKFDHVIFNDGVFKYHPFVTGGKALEAKPGERVRIHFVNAGPNEFSAVDLIAESVGAYPIVTHALTGALRGAIAVLVVSPDAKPAPLMPHTPWMVEPTKAEAPADGGHAAAIVLQ